MAAGREHATTYRTADGGERPLLVFEPDTPARAGVVLFHGGALRTGSADGLAPHCRELAARGLLAVSAGYRLIGQGAASIDDCLADVRLAIEHAGTLGLDASRLAWGGSSAGAHLALVAALTAPAATAPAATAPAANPPAAGPPVGNPRVATAPALVAFNPAGLDLRALPPEERRDLERHAGIAEGRLLDYSLIEFVRRESPPVLIHHGTRDEVEPVAGVRRFRDAMVRAGAECVLLEYAGAGHGFHYPGRGHFAGVVDATARFLRRMS